MSAEERLGEKQLNNQGCLMKIIKYNKYDDIIVEFQDKYKAIVNTQYCNFKSGSIKNPYCPSVLGVGMMGEKYTSRINGIKTKEYNAWINILKRCFDKKVKEKYPTYKDVTCCEEWLLYDNFYEWLHSQENFDKWLNGYKWHVDKDILLKGNKIYKPDFCCIVPENVNTLFTKRDNDRGNLPIGVTKHRDGYMSQCNNPFTNNARISSIHLTPEKAFQYYKICKENIIKQVAKEEYNKGNITRQCYEAMMNYEVEIDD